MKAGALNVREVCVETRVIAGTSVPVYPAGVLEMQTQPAPQYDTVTNCCCAAAGPRLKTMVGQGPKLEPVNVTTVPPSAASERRLPAS